MIKESDQNKTDKVNNSKNLRNIQTIVSEVPETIHELTKEGLQD